MGTLRRRSLALLQKDIGAKTLWTLALGLILIKLVLTSFQMMLAAPDLAPIDDALLFNMAKSITAGNWLGEYNWLTLGKHSFYALWLAALHALGVGPLLAGQLLYAAACIVFLAAIKPLLQNHWLRLFVFTVVLYLPVSWGEYTLRIYRDNIHPALVFLLLSALLGAFVCPAGKWPALLFYYVVAGLSAAAIWLNHEDNLLLLPFLICAVLVHVVQLWCEKQQPVKKWRTLLWLLMGMGLVAAMSRGPWVGAAIGLFVIALASTNPLGNVLKLLMASFGAAVMLVMLPGGEKILDYLPWVGSVDESNITYREMLWTQSWLVIMKNPWIGSIGYETASEFDHLRTGSGFIDIVNSYLGQALANGLIGLGFYVLLILTAMLSTLMLVFRNKSAVSESSIYGVALLGCIASTVITIWTVSSINQIGAIVILLIGAGVSSTYLRGFRC
jgi:hypothetical protein